MNIEESTLVSGLVDECIGSLKNVDVRNPKLVVVFSGPPSSGKSTTAKQIEQKFKGVRIENDFVLRLLAKRFPSQTHEWRNSTKNIAMNKVWERIPYEVTNGLLIGDFSIDRSYQTMLDFSKKHGYKVLLIAMDIDSDTHRTWTIAGGDREFASLESYLNSMEKFRHDQALFLKKYTPDMSLKPGYDIRDVYTLIDQKLSS